MQQALKKLLKVIASLVWDTLLANVENNSAVVIKSVALVVLFAATMARSSATESKTSSVFALDSIAVRQVFLHSPRSTELRRPEV